MYEVKNGILYRDGIAQLAIGQSYYPSYHVQKVPVLESGDRIGEMKKDLKQMREAGFNLVRMAALGEVKMDKEGEVSVNFPFIDELVRECSKNDIASVVRLQGYSMNLRNFEDATMRDQDGQKMPFRWSWFVRNCINHEGIINDNIQGTLVSAKHYGDFEDMVGFQIYNEAAYPTDGFYDYHPLSIQAYRNWLVENSYMSAQDAQAYMPPKRRPYYNEDPQEWVWFRLFCTERMSSFLNQMSDVAKEGYAPAETLTCHMHCPLSAGSAMRGEDYFDIAQGMDIVGITHYINSFRANYHHAALVLDGAESAAAIYGKHAWLVEYNARTDCSLNEWERETYTAVGSAYKGILYYQWRADYPFEDGPEPNGFGMIFNNGDKTVKYDGAVRMNHLLHSLSPYIVESEKLRSHVGILYSKHANAWYDAIDNGEVTAVINAQDRNVQYLQRTYTAMKKSSITPDIVRSCDLDANALGVQALFIPSWVGLSQLEQQQINAYAQTHPVFVYNPKNDGYIVLEASEQHCAPYGVAPKASYNIEALLSVLALKPAVRYIGEHQAMACGILHGSNGYGNHYTITLTNYDDFERPATGGKLLVADDIAAQVQKAKLVTPYEQTELCINRTDSGAVIDLPQITTGAFIMLYNGQWESL